MDQTTEPIIVKIEVELHLKQDDIDFLLKYNDIFQHGYIGYWAYGVGFDGGWIVVEEETFYEEYGEAALEKATKKAIEFYKEHGSLDQFPFGEVHVLDRKAAEKIWAKTAERASLVEVDNHREIDDYDADMLDWAIQNVLLGELRYG